MRKQCAAEYLDGLSSLLEDGGAEGAFLLYFLLKALSAQAHWVRYNALHILRSFGVAGKLGARDSQDDGDDNEFG